MDRIGPSPDSELYQIRMRGVLDKKWSDWFDGFTLTWTDQNETVLTGRVQDQAGLHGILGKIRDLGLDLLLVKKMDCSGFGRDDIGTVYQQDEKG